MTIDDIKNLIDDTVDTNSTTYPDERKVRAINKAISALSGDVLLADWGVWDDFNYGDIPVGYLPLTSGQKYYEFQEDENGAEIQYLNKVLIKTEGASTYTAIDRIMLDDVDYTSESDGSGTPTAYAIHGKTIALSPTPDYTEATGIKLFFQRAIEDVTTSDTTKELGIPAPFHYVVALMASYDYARAKRLDTRNDILKEVTDERKKLVRMAVNDKDIDVRILPASVSAK